MFNIGTTRNIFPVQIYEAEYEDFQSIQPEILSDLNAHFETPAKGNEYFNSDGTPSIIRTGNFLHHDPKLKCIVDFIEFHLREYWKSYNLTKRVDPYILQMWANIVPPNGFTPSHNHNPVHIGGAFYVTASSNQGDLYLESPLEHVEGRMPRDYAHSPLLLVEKIKVSPGKIVLFPGWLDHHTRSNNSNENRIVIGFNLGAWLDYKPKPESPV